MTGRIKRGKIVCTCKRTKITWGENKPVYSILSKVNLILKVVDEWMPLLHHAECIDGSCRYVHQHLH